MAKVFFTQVVEKGKISQPHSGKLNESKIPDFKFTPPPPPQKKSNDTGGKKE